MSVTTRNVFFSRDFEGLFRHQRVALKPLDLFFHSLGVPAVDIPREVRCRDDAELADFFHGVDLGIAEEIRTVANVVGAFGAALHVGRLFDFAMIAALIARAGLLSEIPVVLRGGTEGSLPPY